MNEELLDIKRSSEKLLIKIQKLTRQIENIHDVANKKIIAIENQVDNLKKERRKLQYKCYCACGHDFGIQLPTHMGKGTCVICGENDY